MHKPLSIIVTLVIAGGWMVSCLAIRDPFEIPERFRKLSVLESSKNQNIRNVPVCFKAPEISHGPWQVIKTGPTCIILKNSEGQIREIIIPQESYSLFEGR